MSGLLDRKDAKACHKIPSHGATALQKHLREQQFLPLHRDFGLGMRWDLDLVPEHLGETVPKAFMASSSSGQGPTTKKKVESIHVVNNDSSKDFVCPGHNKATPVVLQVYASLRIDEKKQDMNHTCQN